MHPNRWPLLAAAVLALAALAGAQDPPDAQGWVPLFNGKDLTGWRLRQEKVTVTRYVDGAGNVIPDAKKVKLGAAEVGRDPKGKPIPDAKVALKDGKKVILDPEGKVIPGAKIVLVGGRDAIIDKKGKEVKDARAVQETVKNESGWVVENGELICTRPHGGNDLYTDRTFTDFELHVEFQATSNSGVYLQGRYEIQINDDSRTKPKVVEKDGQKVEVWDTHQCGAIYGRIAPTKNMARPPKEWQSFDVTFRGARGEAGKVAKKARVTLIWNGTKVIDDAEIDGPTGAALDGNVTAPGPLLLQGDHGRVAFRNIKVRPLTTK